ncbi:hypothetical protein N0B31_10275 [Salinirubellus salinus]|uniref:Uncharacterized protein n=1 Tax=Salinirubellus salinus TaxID=1364945 RepID=A0A9E7R673_9EURY|nr:hypothetical protein [Salinirubellus salinus]UWM56661.1 hypothetical protein N0B31_10275 [Salinirubellus salinus]
MSDFREWVEALDTSHVRLWEDDGDGNYHEVLDEMPLKYEEMVDEIAENSMYDRDTASEIVLSVAGLVSLSHSVLYEMLNWRLLVDDAIKADEYERIDHYTYLGFEVFDPLVEYREYSEEVMENIQEQDEHLSVGDSDE